MANRPGLGKLRVRNKLEEKTVVEFGKDKTGRIVCTDVSYV